MINERENPGECSEKSLLVDERQKSNALPCKLFSIEVDLEIHRIKVYDWRVTFRHKPLPRYREMCSSKLLNENRQ